MDKAIKTAILREAAKLYSPTPAIISKETAGIKMFALAFVVDGRKEMLTAWHSNPLRIIDAIRAQIRYHEATKTRDAKPNYKSATLSPFYVN